MAGKKGMTWAERKKRPERIRKTFYLSISEYNLLSKYCKQKNIKEARAISEIFKKGLKRI